MSGAFESTLLRPTRSSNKLWMETGFGVNNGFERYRNSEYPVSDGATPNRAQIYGPFDAVNNPREYVAGVASLTLPSIVPVPASNPAVQTYIVNYNATTNAPDSTGNSLQVTLSTGGSLNITQWAIIGSTYRQFAWAGFRAAYSGQTIFLKITLTQGTTNPVVEINGINVSANFTLTSATPPAWLDASMVPTYRLVGYNWPSGPAPIVTPILGTTSAADDAFYMSTGKWPAWVVAGYNNKTDLLTGDSSTFTSGIGSWAPNGGSITASGGVGVFSVVQGFIDVGTLTAGRKYAITFDVTAITAGKTLTISFTDSPFVFTVTPNATGSFYGEAICTQVSGTNRIYINNTDYSTASFSLDNVKIYQLGSLSLPSIQPINVIDDVSGIGGNCGLILGAATTATSNKKVWRIADLTKTSGNEQLLGGAVFVGTSQDYIKSWTIVNAGGTTTVSLGNVSGGAQYVSGLSVPTGTTVVTLLSNVPLTTNLWCNANTTASLTHIIEGYRTV